MCVTGRCVQRSLTPRHSEPHSRYAVAPPPTKGISHIAAPQHSIAPHTPQPAPRTHVLAPPPHPPAPGHDTKIFLNSTEPPSKRSYIEHTVDKVILVVFVVLFSWCLTSSVYHAQWTTHHLPGHWYMRPDARDAASNPDDAAQTGAVNFLVALLLYSEYDNRTTVYGTVSMGCNWRQSCCWG